MTKKNIPLVCLKSQYLSIKQEIDLAIKNVIESSNFILGKEVTDFESNFSKLNGSPHCVSCANGTDALFLALKAIGIKRGDEVITTAHSWISTSEAITLAGAKPIFCDIDPTNFCLNTDLIEALITKKTKAILPVHIYGHPANMYNIINIAKNNSLKTIEDCAQAHLAQIDDINVGLFGDVGCFSFYPGKNLGAFGDAGGILTSSQELSEWIKLYSRHGGKGVHHFEGINSRMDNIQAAILNVKIKHLKKWTESRREKASYYKESLQGVGDIILPQENRGYKHVYHLYTIRTKHRDSLRDFLKENGIATAINYPLFLPFLPAYSYLKHKISDFPISNQIQSEILSLPLYPELKDNQQEFIIEKVKLFYNQIT